MVLRGRVADFKICSVGTPLALRNGKEYLPLRGKMGSGWTQGGMFFLSYLIIYTVGNVYMDAKAHANPCHLNM